MRVIVPFVGARHPDVVAGVPQDAEWHDVGGDEHAYWRLLRDVWQPGVDLVVVEHDVVCRPDVFAQFEACPEPWCLFGYDTMCHAACQEAWANQLGCTRFRSELIAACPDAVSGLPAELRGWHNLCDHMAGNKIHGVPAPLRPGSVRAAGYSHHWHEPLVVHNPEKGPLGDGYGRRASWAQEG